MSPAQAPPAAAGLRADASYRAVRGSASHPPSDQTKKPVRMDGIFVWLKIAILTKKAQSLIFTNLAKKAYSSQSG